MDCTAGNAWVGLRVNLGQYPGPSCRVNNRIVSNTQSRRRNRRAQKHEHDDKNCEDVENKNDDVKDTTDLPLADEEIVVKSNDINGKIKNEELALNDVASDQIVYMEPANGKEMPSDVIEANGLLGQDKR